MGKANGYSRKSFHRICMAVLTALFAALIAVLLLQNDVDEAALLHTAVCTMIMLLDIVLAVGYSSGHYNTTRLQDQIYMMLLLLVSVSLLVLGVYRLAFFGPAYYFLEPFIVQVSLALTAVWTCLFGLFDLTFFGLPEKRRAGIRNVTFIFSALFIELVITNPSTGLLVGEAGPEGVSPGPLFPLTWAYTLGLSAWYIVMILSFVENRRTKTALFIRINCRSKP